ncbi:FecR domain-containing protein [Bradyrhizobium sp. Cp5.3]|uniref:FecR domain-containing protein n=1 Tax=Bradyrhizobium sp. Cp5.3 TaxID=443598 RepID=UPI0021107B55|nr:FecR domain-containing protein [Bradyrhizobium sp. Cp5.3]
MGERSTVQLAPGVSVELNTLTSLALRSVHDQPAIELVSGEVLVNAQRPPSGLLVMLAAGGRISTSDANFNAHPVKRQLWGG